MSQASGLQVQPAAPAADPTKPAEANVRIVEDASGRQQVRIQTETLAVPEPTDKKEAAPAEKTEDKPAQGDRPARPEWLPAKFETPDKMKESTVALMTKLKAPAAFIAAVEASESGAEVSEIYARYEKEQGGAAPLEEKKADAPKVEEPKDQAPAVPVVKTDEIKAKEVAAYGSAIAGLFDSAGIIGEDFGKRYEDAGGKISEADYKGFEKAGVSRPVLDAWVAGAYGNAKTKAEVLADAHVTELKQSVGGPAEFDKLSDWAAAGNWNADDLSVYNAMVNSGNKSVAKRAVQDLKAAYVKANGNPPKLVDGATTPASQGEKYNSWPEAMADMRDKRYLNNDPAFHAKVTEKLSRSNL